MDSAFWGVIGTIVGAAASIGTTWLTNRNAAALQSSAKAAEQLENRRAFQRQTLVELQDAFHDAIRHISVAYLADRHAHANGIAWGKNILPDGLAEQIRLANRQVMLLVERVHDDSLRKTIKGLMAQANSVGDSGSVDEAEARLDHVTMQSIAAIERTGETLRSLY
jgi:hypothetical protein